MSTDLGVALLPTNEVRDFMIGLNRALRERYETSYELSKIKNLPHLTLYQGTFAAYGDLNRSIRALNSAQQKFGRTMHERLEEVEIVLNNLTTFPSGYVTFQCKRTESLQRLHEDVLALASMVRLKDVQSIWERNKVQLTSEKEEAVRKYGYLDAYELYDPHFTIGRIIRPLNEDERHTILQMLNEKAVNFIGHMSRPSALIIYELGVDAACVNPKEIE